MKKKYISSGETVAVNTNPWAKRLQAMKKNLEKHSLTWRRNSVLLFGQEKYDTTNVVSAASDVKLAYGWGLVKSLETSIYVSDPDALVEAMDAGKREQAKLLTFVWRYDAEEMDVKNSGNILIVDNFVCGFGAVIETCKTKKRTKTVVSRYGKGEEEKLPIIENQTFAIERVPPDEFLPDPMGRKIDLSDHRYIAVSFVETISNLRDDETMDWNLPEGIENWPDYAPDSGPNSDDKTLPTNSAKPDTDPDYKLIKIWEIHDKIERKLIYLTDHGHHEIGTAEWPIELDFGSKSLFPVTIMSFHHQPKTFYGKPELDLVADQLMEMNKIESLMREDSITKWRKYVTIAGLLSGDQAANFVDPNNENSLITISSEALTELIGTQNKQPIDVRNLIAAVEDVSLKRDLPLRRQLLEQSIQQILGYGPADRGGMPKTRSAREAVAIKDQMDKRLHKRMDTVADFYRDLGKKHIKFLQQRMDVDRYVRIKPDTAALAEFRKYRKDDIEGEFAFTVYSGTSAPKTTEAKKQAEMQFFQAAAPIVLQTGGDVRPLFKRLCYYMQWDGWEEMFGQHEAVLIQLAQALTGFQQGKPGATNDVLNLAAAAVKTGVSKEKLMAAAQQPGGGQGSPAKPDVVGQRGDPNPAQTAMGVAT